jgi:hypothetical protein
MPIVDKITDVTVSIDVDHPQPTIGLKNPAILVKDDSTESLKEYTTLDDVEADFGVTTSVYSLSQTIFDQDPAPESISVIKYTGDSPDPTTLKAGASTNVTSTPTSDGAVVKADPIVGTGKASDTIPTSGAGKALYDYFYANYEYVLLADYDKAAALAAADMINNGGYDGKGYHLMFLQFDDSNKADAADFAQYGRVWTFYHTDASEHYAAALAAKGAQPDAGKVSWKFVSDLADVTPETMTATDAKALEAQGFILYYQKAAHANQTDDKNVAGNYIDFIQGMDWIKATTETNLQNMLSTSGKVPYNAQGLSMVDTTLKAGLDQAYNQGIIGVDANGKPDYSTSIPGVGNATPPRVADIAARVLRNVKFTYTPSSAVNEIHVTASVQDLS